MITDEKRREIASELRKQAAYSSGSLGEWWQRLQEIVTGEIDFANPQETYRAIANLIDRPTCTMTYRPEWSDDELYPTEAYQCSNCDCVVNEGITEYCPSCGYRVSNYETEPER